LNLLREREAIRVRHLTIHQNQAEGPATDPAAREFRPGRTSTFDRDRRHSPSAQDAVPIASLFDGLVICDNEKHWSCHRPRFVADPHVACIEIQDRGNCILWRWFAPLQDLVSLERVLARRVGDLGTSIRRGVTVTDFSQADDTVTIHTSTDTVQAGWLIGCDGGRSTVRKLAGFAFPGTPPEITAYSAIVQITDPGTLNPGWNRAPAGVYVYGPGPNRMLVVEFRGPPADRDAPVTTEELQASLRHVSGTDVTITAVIAASSPTMPGRQEVTARAVPCWREMQLMCTPRLVGRA
jgi:hypothetical protein